MKIQRLNLDSAAWEDALATDAYERHLRVVTDDGEVYDITDAGNGRLDLRAVDGNFLVVIPKASNTITVASS